MDKEFLELREFMVKHLRNCKSDNKKNISSETQVKLAKITSIRDDMKIKILIIIN